MSGYEIATIGDVTPPPPASAANPLAALTAQLTPSVLIAGGVCLVVGVLVGALLFSGGSRG